MLEVRGMVYVDVRRDSDVDATITHLQTIAQDGDESAAPGSALCQGVLAYISMTNTQPRAPS